jgi:hypothetical protein
LVDVEKGDGNCKLVGIKGRIDAGFPKTTGESVFGMVISSSFIFFIKITLRRTKHTFFSIPFFQTYLQPKNLNYVYYYMEPETLTEKIVVTLVNKFMWLCPKIKSPKETISFQKKCMYSFLCLVVFFWYAFFFFLIYVYKVSINPNIWPINGIIQKESKSIFRDTVRGWLLSGLCN